jgi:hypothetical protein
MGGVSQGKEERERATHRVMTGLFLELAGRLPVLSHCHQSHTMGRMLAADALVLSLSLSVAQVSAWDTQETIRVRKGEGSSRVAWCMFCGWRPVEPEAVLRRSSSRSPSREVGQQTRFSPGPVRPATADDRGPGRDKVGRFHATRPRCMNRKMQAIRATHR